MNGMHGKQRELSLMKTLVSIFLLLNCAVACTPPSLILKTDDATFIRSQGRMIRTIQLVDQQKPAAPERILFLQAEGLYDYRFAFPSRNVSSYLAEMAAAVTDFPAFQSLAGMLDMADLRLKIYDGSVQLWETLLYQYPQTPLRPLTLYRLGWAYRSTGVKGLPRRSGDEAFNLLVRDYPNSHLAALANEAKVVPWKSKRTAATFTLVPGLGQMYVGEYGDGAARLGIALASLALTIAPSYIAYERRHDLNWGRDWPLLGTGVIGLVILSIDYTTAYQDVMQEVVEFNEREEANFETKHPEAP